MGRTLFVFGLPGSGKSAAARYIKSIARHKAFHPRRFRDYTILYKMFQDDQMANNEKKRYRSTLSLGYDGFDVLDLDEYDKALQQLHQNIQWRKKLVDESRELLLIEFSRTDYCEALTFFTSFQLHDAHFLFINSDIPTCKARITVRANHPQTLDDRYVSDYVFEAYSHREHQLYFTEVPLQLKQRFGIPKEHIRVIHNGSETSVKQFYQAVESFVDDLLMIKV